jgi:hypothetical protein
MNFTWDNIQQFVRVALYTGGSVYFGTEFANGDQFQAALGAVMVLGSFVWFLVKNPVTKPVE